MITSGIQMTFMGVAAAAVERIRKAARQQKDLEESAVEGGKAGRAAAVFVARTASGNNSSADGDVATAQAEASARALEADGLLLADLFAVLSFLDVYSHQVPQGTLLWQLPSDRAGEPGGRDGDLLTVRIASAL